MDYETMLRLWRFEPVGSKYFRGEIGDYFKQTMQMKAKQMEADEKVKMSKKIGWEN